jgi:hypothetical protein
MAQVWMMVAMLAASLLICVCALVYDGCHSCRTGVQRHQHLLLWRRPPPLRLEAVDVGPYAIESLMPWAIDFSPRVPPAGDL